MALVKRVKEGTLRPTILLALTMKKEKEKDKEYEYTRGNNCF